MRYGINIVFIVGIFFFTGCAMLEPGFDPMKIGNKSSEINETKEFVEKNTSIIAQLVEEEVIESSELDNGRLIVNVFDDELYFEKDKVGKDKAKVVIKYLDALSWEKKVLNNLYKKNKRVWSKKQSQGFRNILEKDKYLSLCSDRKYWENLEFEESEPERDVLYSILLIKYLNNLSHGCPKWVESNGTIKDENSKEFMKIREVFPLLAHGAILDKLFTMYAPKEKEFYSLLENYRSSLSLAKKDEVLKVERLEIENFKCKECRPNYKKK